MRVTVGNGLVFVFIDPFYHTTVRSISIEAGDAPKPAEPA